MTTRCRSRWQEGLTEFSWSTDCPPTVRNSEKLHAELMISTKWNFVSELSAIRKFCNTDLWERNVVPQQCTQDAIILIQTFGLQVLLQEVGKFSLETSCAVLMGWLLQARICYMCSCVCVCVRKKSERERASERASERKRARAHKYALILTGLRVQGAPCTSLHPFLLD